MIYQSMILLIRYILYLRFNFEEIIEKFWLLSTDRRLNFKKNAFLIPTKTFFTNYA